MARMPGADYRPLAIHGAPMSGHDIACLHTMVGSLWGTDGYFRTGAANSHFGTGGDGHLVQWLDTAIESWANLDGNPRVITCENADMGPEFPPWTGSDVPPFTAAQGETLARWLAWVCSPAAHADCPTSWTCHAAGIPLELIPDDRPGRRGVGYHRHGIDDWRVPAGVLWSSHRGKVCPGDRRIAQVPQIIARAKQIAGGAPTLTEDDMPRFDLIRNKDNGLMVLAAPGIWRGLSNSGYVTLVASMKLVNSTTPDLDVPTNEFAFLQSVYLSGVAAQLDPNAIAAAVAAKIAPSAGGLTVDEVTAAAKAAVTEVLTEGVGAAPAAS
jgi:hypothetical protein